MDERDQIIAKFNTTTKQNGGIPLSTRQFFAATNLSPRDLHRCGWPTHGSLLTSQGYAPRSMKLAYTDSELFDPIAQLMLSIGHFPSQNEREVERHRNPKFPSSEAYARRARKEPLDSALLNWCREEGLHQKLVGMLEHSSSPEPRISRPVVKGYVYMIRSGALHKIGRETTKGARQSAAGTWLEEPEVVHRIATADPAGVERYWHERFKRQDKHVKGEPFRLTAGDVAEFKRRKKII